MKLPLFFLMLSLLSLGVLVTVASRQTTTGQSIQNCPNPPNIPDYNLQKAIKKELGISGDISCQDLENLTKLKARNRWRIEDSAKISSLEGIQYATNLSLLELNHNLIENISPLRSLSNLRILMC